MDFFDGLISDVEALLRRMNFTSFPSSKNPLWEDLGRNEVIMLRDSAYELDGVGFNLVTSKDLGESGIDVYGTDLSGIKKNTPFARVSIIQIDDVGDEQKAYNLIRKIEYSKYHFHPKGYMMRASSSSQKESVRVSKEAISSGISFEKVGSMLINKYKENPAVKAVKIIFVTDENAEYKEFDSLAKKNYEITEALNHIMNNIKFDCDSCNLKAICDEVEGMRELHFKNAES